ncbi:nuclear transport factor 2 family protein [Sphingobium sp. Cam5-1]|uniref:nuclear transport factor 2 family protein n=1 Tax=Sphingobium sp. Cam5-1 TaxID=2789327 RepID=UPI0018AD2DD7|nr:nuclear transport factor 2 family protein [Sphingobium sp. Cam5-1]QPI74773.1 nuclear transport factor 2 family protein [Sphingobium sp. Cam5-1]
MQGRKALTASADFPARIAILEDREAIRDLIARYGPLVDAGNCAGAAALWAEDGVYEVGGFGSYTGRAAIQALLEGESHQSLIHGGAAHVLSPPVIDLDGDSATARTYSVVFRKTGDSWEAHRASANSWHLVRVGTEWKVARRINRLLDGSPDARALIGGR